MRYNKLVRDKIPEIIKQKGGNAITHIANNDEFWQKLLEKLNEEVAEFQKENNPEELADILEVIYTLAAAKNITPEQLENMRKNKEKDRGGFKDKIILEES